MLYRTSLQLLLFDDVDVMLRWRRALAHEEALDRRPGLVEDVLDAARLNLGKAARAAHGSSNTASVRVFETSRQRTERQRWHDRDCAISSAVDR